MANLIKNYLKFLWSEAAKSNNEILTSFIEPVREAKILDLGCDTGELIIKRVKKIKKTEIWGIDIRRKAILASKKLGIKAIEGDIEKGLPFKDNFFDIVSANQIIEHLIDVDKFVKEINRVLKPKGYIVLSTENLSSWHNLLSLLLGWQAFSQNISSSGNLGNPFRLVNCKNLDQSNMHVKILTPQGLKGIFNFHGFKIKNFFGAGYYPFPPPISNLLSKVDPIHCAFIGLKAGKFGGTKLDE